MNSHPDIMLWLAVAVLVGAVLTGFATVDSSTPAMIASENLIR